MAGIDDLDVLLATMDPVLHPERYAFAATTGPSDGVEAFARIVEDEGTTLVLLHDEAVRHGLDVGFVAARITLTVHSALDAVGLTAAVATALANDGISCNVIAGYFHDHLFVADADAERALAALRSLSARAADGSSPTATSR
jgi:hypothetical protein